MKFFGVARMSNSDCGTHRRGQFGGFGASVWRRVIVRCRLYGAVQLLTRRWAKKEEMRLSGMIVEMRSRIRTRQPIARNRKTRGGTRAGIVLPCILIR